MNYTMEVEGVNETKTFWDWNFDYINDEENWIVLNGGEDDIICGNLGAP